MAYFYDPILNGSFEEGTLGSTPTSWVAQGVSSGTGTAVKTDEEKIEFDYGLKVTHTNASGWYQAYQVFTLPTDQKYRVSGWVKSDYSGGGLQDVRCDVLETSSFTVLGKINLGDQDLSQGLHFEYDVYVPPAYSGSNNVQIICVNQTGQTEATDVYFDKIEVQLSPQPKRFLYKIYDSTGAYVETWNDVINEPQFTSTMNFGVGEMTVELARGANSFGESDSVNYMNRLDLYVFDAEQPQGQIIYSGYIAKYEPIFDGTSERVVVTFLGYAFQFQRYMYADGSETTEFTHSSQDPEDIFKDILDKFTALGGTPDYDGSSTSTTGTSVSYTFNVNTVKEALDKTIELSPVGWFYYVNPQDNIVEYGESSASADHTFTIGRDVISIRPEKSTENMVNEVYFTGGDTGGGSNLYKYYERSSSITSYGRFVKKIVDNRVTSSTTAQTIAEAVMDAFDSPVTRTTLVIMDNHSPDNTNRGYDIESIKPGDTARVLGYTDKGNTKWDQATWDSDKWDYDISDISATVQIILKVQYIAGNKVRLELSNQQPQIAKRIEDINRNLEQSKTLANPSQAT